MHMPISTWAEEGVKADILFVQRRLSTVGGPHRSPRVPIKGPGGKLLPLPRSLRVCTMSADFWGLPTAGGTATAYGLLTSALSEDPSLDVRALVFVYLFEYTKTLIFNWLDGGVICEDSLPT